MTTRRHFLGLGLTAALSAAGAWLGRIRPARGRGLLLRPPGALPAGAFEDACVRCLKCVSACPNGCLEVHGFEAGLERAFTPFLKARERGCTLCGECARVCPSGALVPFETTREGWLAGVAMGKAHVDREMCYSFQGRTCGACYRACPLAGQAIRIGVFEQPHVQREFCVGCGLCEQACLHIPQAIRVIPREYLEEMGA